MAVPRPMAQEVEEEGGFQLDELDLERLVAEELEGAAQQVATDVGAIIERCETARAELGKAAALLFERREAFFDIGEAAELVRTKFSLAVPGGGLLQEARRDLLYVLQVGHPEANDLFEYFTTTTDFDAPPGGEEAKALWADHYFQFQADAQAREALRRLDVADDASLAAHQALGLCQVQCAAGEPPGAHLSDAEVRLERAIHEVDKALAELRGMENSLQELEQAILIATGEAPLPPPA